MNDKATTIGCVTLAVCLLAGAVVKVTLDTRLDSDAQTHPLVVETFERVNQGDRDGVAKLFCPLAPRSTHEQTFGLLQRVEDSGHPLTYEVEKREVLDMSPAHFTTFLVAVSSSDGNVEERIHITIEEIYFQQCVQKIALIR
jgi:hypothetical protein